MLQAGRVDYTLGDWVEVDFMEKTLGSTIPFVTYPMQEDTGNKPNYISYTRNAWGKAVVDKLHKQFNDPEIIETTILPKILKWIRPVDQAEYRENYMREVYSYFRQK